MTTQTEPLVTPVSSSSQRQASDDAEREVSVDSDRDSSSYQAEYAADDEHPTIPDLPGPTSAQSSLSWQRIQSQFVDDPRKAVGAAHQLVSGIEQRIVDGFARERRELERHWSNGASVSTEDMRICLQRYRTYFLRLLPSLKSTENRVESERTEATP